MKEIEVALPDLADAVGVYVHTMREWLIYDIDLHKFTKRKNKPERRLPTLYIRINDDFIKLFKQFIYFKGRKSLRETYIKKFMNFVENYKK